MDKDGSEMNAEEREYSERKSLSKIKPWYKEGSDEAPPRKILQDEKSDNETNDWWNRR